MNTQKVSLTISKEIIHMIDSISKDLGISRSKYVSLVLKEKLREEKEKKLKEAYDEVFSDQSVKDEQLVTSKWFEGSGSKDGQEW